MNDAETVTVLVRHHDVCPLPRLNAGCNIGMWHINSERNIILTDYIRTQVKYFGGYIYTENASTSNIFSQVFWCVVYRTRVISGTLLKTSFWSVIYRKQVFWVLHTEAN